MAYHSPGDPAHELRVINERLLLAGLRQHELVEQAEHGRREQATLLDSVNVGIVGFDSAMRCTAINRAAAQMLEAVPAIALGQDIHGVMHAGCTKSDTSSAQPACLLVQVLRSGARLRVDDGTLWQSDRTPFPAIYSADPIVVEGRPLGGVVAFINIAERKRAEAAALQAGQMEQRLEGVKLAVREVAHRLNNDLMLAVGTLDLLLHDSELSPVTLENVHIALAALDTAAQHLAQFQRVVRVETQESPIGLTLDVERSI